MRAIDGDALRDRLQNLADDEWNQSTTTSWAEAYKECADIVEDAPTIEPEPHWVPCSERLPEDDVMVLISYRYKEGEGDTSHTYIDITTYGQMYFGGNKVGDHKHWRAPFEYFESNYEVIAWMPLPEPYKEGE